MPRDVIPEQIEQVQGLIRHSIETSSLGPLVEELGIGLDGGKMLRSRLLLRVAGATGVRLEDSLLAAAAVEMVHAASLLHDDVIDGGRMRRGRPALWLEKGARAAVLMGDLLLSRAVGILQKRLPHMMPVVVETLQEMCDAEAQQEFFAGDNHQNWETCVDIARRKTGSLFGLAAACCHEFPESDLGRALREAGCRLGTAYQLGDDIFDAYHDPALADKTLGTDALGNKVTAAAVWEAGGVDTVEAIHDFVESSLDLLSAWPHVREAWAGFVSDELMPVIERFTAGLCERRAG